MNAIKTILAGAMLAGVLAAGAVQAQENDAGKKG